MRVVIALLAALHMAGAAASTGVPAFTVQAPNGRTSLLIGSMHVPHQGLREPAASVLNGARVLVVEHAASSEPAQLELAPEVLEAMRGGVDKRAAWADRLTARQRDRIRRNLACPLAELDLSSQYDVLFKLKSPALLSALAFIPCAPKGVQSRDAFINREAELRQIPVSALESPEQIRTRRKALPEQVYASALLANAELDLGRTYRELANALNDGDFDAVAAISDRGFADQDARDLFRRVMLTERNAAWMSSLRVELDRGDAVVLVGAAHLPGKQGLLALLNSSGYRVVPTLLPAAQ